MRHGQSVAWALAAVVAALPATSRAQGPTFDCAKAQGEVETLICRDPSLAALDRRLAEAYRAASAKARGPVLSELRATQRGWVKGRNDCWKANGQPTWVTASWTVDTVKGCVDAQYRLRISELQSTWRLVTPRTRSYMCQKQPANEVVANFFETDPATIQLERGDRVVTLWQVGAAGDGTYEGANVSLVHRGDELKISWLNTHTGKTDLLECAPR